MSLLRIRCALVEPPLRCQWVLVDAGRAPMHGEGTLAELPRHAARVQLVIPAAQVLITRAQLPPAARRSAGSVLAFAVEDETLGEPEVNQTIWLGSVENDDVLAVVDKPGLKRWLNALDSFGFSGVEVHCETLLLPRAAGEWSLAWNGREGFVRTGEFEGTATDCGSHREPPLSLRLALEAAPARAARPTSIAVYMMTPDAAPDHAAWQRELGVPLRLAGPWDWRTAPPDAGISLLKQRKLWRVSRVALARLRPAAWIAGCALAIHAFALVTDWTLLAAEQRALRRQMEVRFRATFPDAVAVVDPALQMRRKLAEARHIAGKPDSGDFLPMIENIAVAAKVLPTGSVRIASYENGRLTVELAAVDPTAVQRIVERLQQAGLSVDTSVVAPRSASGAVVITVRAS